MLSGGPRRWCGLGCGARAGDLLLSSYGGPLRTLQPPSCRSSCNTCSHPLRQRPYCIRALQELPLGAQGRHAGRQPLDLALQHLFPVRMQHHGRRKLRGCTVTCERLAAAHDRQEVPTYRVAAVAASAACSPRLSCNCMAQACTVSGGPLVRVHASNYTYPACARLALAHLLRSSLLLCLQRGDPPLQHVGARLRRHVPVTAGCSCRPGLVSAVLGLLREPSNTVRQASWNAGGTLVLVQPWRGR
jgi:hypothetical protein